MWLSIIIFFVITFLRYYGGIIIFFVITLLHYGLRWVNHRYYLVKLWSVAVLFFLYYVVTLLFVITLLRYYGSIIIFFVIMLLRYSLRRCYFFFITLLHYYRTGQDITLFVITLLHYCRWCHYFFVICHYVVTLLPAVLLFSVLYYRHCFYSLSCYGFKFRAWIIFFW